MVNSLRERVTAALKSRRGQIDVAQDAATSEPTPTAEPERSERVAVSGGALADKQKYLSEIEIFCDLSQQDMDYIAKTTTMMTTEKGKIFYLPEEAGEVVFLLKKGRVQLYRLSPEGRKLVIATLTPGAVFGEMSLIGQGMYNTFAEAVEDCLICVMSRAEMVQLLQDKPQVALRILDIVGRRLQLAENQLEEVAFRTVPVRLALLLLRLAGIGPEQTEAHQANGSAQSSREPQAITGLTHQELADMIGTYRETVSLALNDFKARGLVDVAPKRIALLDVEGLRALSEA